MKIASSGIGTVATAMSSSKAHHAVVAASAYPDDWAWSVDFAPTAAFTEINGHASSDAGIITDEATGVGVSAGAAKAAYYVCFHENDFPSTITSGDLTKALSGYGKYLTVYFKIETITAQPTLWLNDSYWGHGSQTGYGNGIVPYNEVRKNNSHADTGASPTGNYTAGEYISVSLDMSTEVDGGGVGWLDSGTDPNNFCLGIATGWSESGSIILHGLVVSSKNNKFGDADYSSQIRDITLPITIS
jgi:hypothetical protein